VRSVTRIAIAMKAITYLARGLRRRSTEAERRLWRALRNSHLGFRVKRQYPIGKYVADFVIHSIRLVIELDGGQHALTAEADAHRTRALEAQGYRVIRFWNSDVMENLEGVVERIRREILAPFPSPPLGGEGGAREAKPKREGED
jgi:very-short-patch-repair endonuclease